MVDGILELALATRLNGVVSPYLPFLAFFPLVLVVELGCLYYNDTQLSCHCKFLYEYHFNSRITFLFV